MTAGLGLSSYPNLYEAFPEFARLAQRALNSANTCRQSIGDIEMACQLADFHMAAVDDGADNPMQIAIDAAQESVGSSFGYCNVLLEYSMQYGGVRNCHGFA